MNGGAKVTQASGKAHIPLLVLTKAAFYPVHLNLAVGYLL